MEHPIHEAQRHPNGALSRVIHRNNIDNIIPNRYKFTKVKKTVNLGYIGNVPAKLFYAEIEDTSQFVAIAKLPLVHQEEGLTNIPQLQTQVEDLHDTVLQQDNMTDGHELQIIECLHDLKYVYVVYNIIE